VVGKVLAGRWPRSVQARGQVLVLAALLFLTIGAWALTVYQARIMDMPMGVAVRGVVEAPAADEDVMAGMPGMAMDDMADAAAAGMSGMGWTWDALIAFVVVWAVMMAAMMLPTATPMLLLYHAIARKRQAGGHALVATWIFCLGYLAVWSAIGVVTWSLVQAGSELANRMSMTDRATWAPIALGAVLLGAGLYQFTPLKASCLRQCQLPIRFLMSRWRDGFRGALRLGFLHGAYCLGCCWALFAVLVATGVMSLAWMLLLTLVVVVEKLLPFGPRSSRFIGAGLVILGVVVAAGRDLPWTV
jgi:predicted metal-binding membrane protein